MDCTPKIFSFLKKRTHSCVFFCRNRSGFALIEILTALFLVSMILLAIPMAVNSSNREKLEEAIDTLDRAVRFATNESVLKNAMVRLRIDLEKSPVEYCVEVAPNGNLALPKDEDTSRMSIKELEREKEKQEKLNAKFSKVQEFKDTTKGFPENVTILGIAYTDNEKIKNEGNLNIYFYPSGERDGAIILMATEEEVAGLDVMPFQDRTNVRFEPLRETNNEDELYDAQMSIAKEMVDKWIKD